MKIRAYKLIIAVAVFLMGVTLSFSCRKNPSPPPVKAVATGPSATIQQLRTMYTGMSIKFTSNTLLHGVITADENSGNLYKQVYVRDNSGTFAQTNYYGAISLHFLHGTQGILNTGDSVAFNLNGATLAQSTGGSLELDSIDPYNNIIHLKTGLNPQPLIATLPQLNTFASGEFIYDAQLVQLNNVEFIEPNVGTMFAIPQQPPAAPQNVNKYVCDYIGNTMVAYNSGYANFAGSIIPNNSGTITAVANLYTTMQLSLRSYTDVKFTNAYNPIVYDTITQNFSCEALASKNTIMAAGWKTIDIAGSLTWQGAQYGVSPNWKYSPSASNYKTTDVKNDIWLISPPIVAPSVSTQKKYMDFTVASQYCTNKRLLSVLISGSFNGTNIIPSQWIDISSLYPYIPASTSAQALQYKFASDGSFLLLNGPQIPPTPHQGFTAPAPNNGTFYIAFRYQTNTNYVDSTGSTYLLGSFFLRNN